jgi:histidine kinase
MNTAMSDAMARLPHGFLAGDEIYAGYRIRACHGRRESDGTPVVVHVTIVDPDVEAEREGAEARSLDGLMDALFEASGARRGFLFITRGGAPEHALLDAVAATTSRPEAPGSSGADAGEREARLPLSVARHVACTQESLALSDPAITGPFCLDPYVARVRPHALLCAPLADAGQLAAVVYLEVDGDDDGFTEARRSALARVATLGARSILATRRSVEIDLHRRALERELFEQARRLSVTSARVTELERRAQELQMAGGFAHEIRNALGGAKLFLHKGLKDAENKQSVKLDKLCGDLRECAGDPARVPLVARDLEGFIRSIGRVEQQLERMLRGVETAVGRGLKIAQLMMEYARVGQEVPGVDKVPLRPMVESIFDESAEELAQQRIATLVAIDPSRSLKIREEHLYAILKNLVLNARDAILERPARATAGSERNDRIEVTFVEEGGRGVLRVRDTGVGISAEHKAKLFSPFFSTKASTGMGLGLNMVMKLVTMYDGVIEVSSKQPEGTSFDVVFPASALSG